MIHIIEGDLFSTNADVICHQVNYQGKMGSGVAKQIKEKYPEAYKEYKEVCNHFDTQSKKEKLLGWPQLVKIHNTCDKYIANMFCQLNYGHDGKRYTNYEAVYNALEHLDGMFASHVTFAFPYCFGCDRGGANWNIILKMIEVVFKDREIFVYKLK